MTAERRTSSISPMTMGFGAAMAAKQAGRPLSPEWDAVTTFWLAERAKDPDGPPPWWFGR